MKRMLSLMPLIVLTFLFSCKSNNPPKETNTKAENVSQQQEIQTKPTDTYPWLKGTWLSTGEKYYVSGDYIRCFDEYNHEKWNGSFALDEENHIVIDRNKDLSINPKDKTIIYTSSGYPLIKYEDYSLPSEYKWLIGVWSDGASFVYITDNLKIGFYDGAKKCTNKGIFVVDDGMLLVFLENQSDDVPSYSVSSHSKSLAYEGGETELWKLKSDEEVDKLVKMNQKKRIIGEWINETTPGYDAYHLIFSENGRGRYAMVINNRIVTDERFTWELNGNEIKTKITHTGINTAANTGGVETYTYLESSDEIKGYGDGAYFKRNKHIKLLDDGSAESLESRIKIDATDGNEDIDCSVKHIRTLSLIEFIDMMLSKNQQRSTTLEKLESLKNQVYDITVKIYRATCDGTVSTLYVVKSDNQIFAKVSEDAMSGVFYDDDGSVHMSWGNKI